MPDELIPAEQASPAPVPERDFIAEMNEVLTVCAQATQLCDLRECENAVRRAKFIFAEAGKTGFEGIELLNILKLVIQILSGYAQMSAFQIEARFAEALEKGNDITSESLEALNIINKIIDEGAEGPDITLIKVMLEYYNILGPAGVAYINAEQIAYTGKPGEYRAALIKASGLYKRIESLEYNDNPSVIQLYAFGSNMAERLINRARYFEFVQRENINKYIKPEGNKVFIIHGHLDEAAITLQQLLKEDCNLDSVILKNEANAGDSVIEKFETIARDCCYAVAIISSDDLVKKENEKYYQARPNVLFELGWFYGRYGRSRVCLIKQKGTQIPSDLGGIISIDFTEEIDEVFYKLRKELKFVDLIQ